MRRITAYMFSSETNGGSEQIADNDYLSSDKEFCLPIITFRKQCHPFLHGHFQEGMKLKYILKGMIL